MLPSRLALFVCGVVGASAASAQPAPPQSEPIVVERIADSQKQIDHFISQLTPAPIHGQLSRFETKVCPLSIGLAPERNALVIERMRRVAAAAAIPLAARDCRPNVILIVTNSKSALLEQLFKKRSYMFPDSWSVSHIHELERDPAPALAWAIEGVTTGDSAPLDYGSEAPLNRTARAASRLTPAARPYFTASIVLVEAKALDGLTTTQLADYAAMRAFVRTDPTKIDASAPTSILALLDTPMGQPVPLTLTPWDMSFLKSFYATRANAYAEYQRAQIKTLMNRDLDRRRNEH